MKLYYNSRSEAHHEIWDRMKSMSLAFETEDAVELPIQLKDGKDVFHGELVITKHLDKIAGELHNWYYCNC